MESSHLVIFSTSGKFITKFNVLRCISLSETLFWTGARGRIPITLIKGMSGQTIISIASTNLGPFGANSGITVGQSSSIRWYSSIFQKLHRFPGN